MRKPKRCWAAASCLAGEVGGVGGLAADDTIGMFAW